MTHLLDHFIQQSLPQPFHTLQQSPLLQDQVLY